MVAFGRQRLRWREFIVSVTVSVVLCVLLYLKMDVHDFRAGFSRVSYWLLLPVLVLEACSWACRACRWKVLLASFSSVRVATLLRLVLIGAMISAVVPARAGEFWRAHAVGRQAGFSRSTAFGTIVVERVLDGLVLAILASVAALAVGPTTPIAILIGSMMVLFSAGLALIAILARSEQAKAFTIGAVRLVAPSHYRSLFDEKIQLFFHGLGALRHSRALIGAVLLSLLIYIVDGAAFWLLGVAFGLTVSPQSFLLVVAVGNLAVALPVSIGGVGPFEFFVQQALGLLGVASSVALAYAVFIHALILAFLVAAGLCSVWAGLRGRSARPETRAIPESGELSWGLKPTSGGEPPLSGSITIDG